MTAPADAHGKLPVHPMTRVGLALVGLIVGAMPGILLANLPLRMDGTARAAIVVGALVGCARGAAVSVRFSPGDLWIRNLWRSYSLDASGIERVDDVRGSGMLNATTPALVIAGKRLRVPLHAAMLWGHFWRGGVSDRDRERASVIRRWADEHRVPVTGSVALLTDAPDTPRWSFRRRGQQP